MKRQCPFLIPLGFENLRLKTYGFLRLDCIFILAPFPRSLYVYTSLARQPTLSARNPRRRGSCLTE